jgi:hypothetical protein
MNATQDLLRYAEKQAMLLDKLENAEFGDSDTERNAVAAVHVAPVYDNIITEHPVERRDVDAGSERGAETADTRGERDVIEGENSESESRSLPAPENERSPQGEAHAETEEIPPGQVQADEGRAAEHENGAEEHPESRPESESESAVAPKEEPTAAAERGEEPEHGAEGHGNEGEGESHSREGQEPDAAAGRGEEPEHGPEGHGNEGEGESHSQEGPGEESEAGGGGAGGTEPEHGAGGHGNAGGGKPHSKKGEESAARAAGRDGLEHGAQDRAVAAQLHALAAKKRQTFDVRVPLGVKPGQVCAR